MIHSGGDVTNPEGPVDSAPALRVLCLSRIIRKVISEEQQYIKDLDCIEEVFIRPLRNADPPIIRNGVDEFIEEVFGNILDLRECNRHLLGTMHVRRREQDEIISRIGDIFLNAATEFRVAYPTYIAQIPGAKRGIQRSVCMLKLSECVLPVRVFAAVDQELYDRIPQVVGHPAVKRASEAVRFKANEL